ncbi:MAG: YkgJ family cysteine cluster protein [Alphaproteobacteria bacterium]|nr:YkgJ family cysteine cluster protein [Alphaproteobacteria bacterium]
MPENHDDSQNDASSGTDPADPTVRARNLIARGTIAQRGDTAKEMAKGPGADVLKLARRALRRAEEVIIEVLSLVPPPKPIACKAGCPWCCHIRLTATPPEVLLVLDYIREHFTAPEIAALERKVANVDAFTRGRDGEDRAKQRLPCPLLKDGACSVHSVRPLSCRAVVSVDVAACKRAYDSHMEEPVPQHDLQILAANGIGYGILAGLADVSFSVEDAEMNAALALGLADKDIGQRWLRGEPVFTPATLTRRKV